MKTAVITGASRGIGTGIATLFAENGYNVVINYHNSEREALALANKTGGLAVKADVSVQKEADTLIQTAIDTFGSVDVLVNNAGVSVSGLIQDMTDDDYNKIFDINMRGVFHVTKAILPFMIRRGSGSIINISSMWGIAGASCESLYSASKGAVILFSRSAAKELAPSGIRVNCICPGVIDTDMNKCYSDTEREALREETPLGRFGTPRDVAEAVLFLASEKASFITGQVLGVDGGFIL